MPFERELLHARLERRARKARDFGGIPDYRGPIRAIEGEDVQAGDGNARFEDITNMGIIGIDVIGGGVGGGLRT